ncbi:hypothetical protein [uncultured Desulfobacter sp.]|uniref:hypothetical protein n=1 Tax=uncultured Desulfobacter sp. TaxID=240139 RepID=UPI0029C720F1|nr:hypothetical protein [uncultured Desulfobacter sp.]
MSFAETFFSALGGTSAAVLILGYLARNFLENRLKKDLEDHKAMNRDWENQRKIELNEQADIKETVKKYSRIILVSASDLQDRLWHLCERQSKSKNKVLLAEDQNAQMYGSWPMTKRHYLISSMYLFARYFFWIEVLKREVRFLEFSEDDKTNEFNYHVKKIERMFAETSLQQFAKNRISTDKPVFQLMQSEIGDALAENEANPSQTISFHRFRINYDELVDSNEGMAQLEDLLKGAMSDAKSNFCLRRLKLICNSLHDLVLFLHAHNNLSPAEGLERVSVPSFDENEFEKLWPSSPNNSIQPTSYVGG